MVNIEMSDAEYQDWLHSQKSKPVTQEEKQKLYEEAERAEEERIERQLDEECLFNQWDGIEKTE